MPAPSDPPRPAARPAVPAWLVAAIAFAVVMSVIVVLRAERSTDFRDFWRTALNFRLTGSISAELGVHNYPPIFPILCTPLSLLPLEVAIVLFTWLSIAAFAWTVFRVADLCGLERTRAPTVIFLVLLMGPYVVSCTTLGAFGLVLLALTVEALWLLRRGADVRAGVLLALATMLKLLPGALFVFLLLRGRWRALVAGGAMLVVVGLGLPTLLLGYEESIAQHRGFYERAVRGHSAWETIHAEKPVKANYSNNALPMVLRRLLSPLDGSKRREDEAGWTVNLLDLSGPTIWFVYLALFGSILLVSAWAARPGTDLVRGYAIWSAVMLLASPLVWTHYLPLALLPLAWLLPRADRGRRVALAALLVWTLGALALAIPQARGAGAQLGSVLATWLAVVLLDARSQDVEA